MLAARLCVGLLILGLGAALPGLASGRSGGAPSGFAGDIVTGGVARTCTTCHTGHALNDAAGQGSVTIDAPDAAAPGETVTVTVTVENGTPAMAGGRRQGFSAIVKDPSAGADGTFVGSYTIPDPGAVRLTDGNDTYLTHTTGSNQATSWTFDWTAPSTDAPSEVVVYAAGNAADGAGQEGDYIYTATHTISLMPVAAEGGPLKDAGVEWGGVWPNPARNQVRAELRLDAPRAVAVRVMDGRGRTVRSVASGARAAGASTVRLDVGGLAPGLYFLVAETESGRRTRTLNVVR